MLKLKRASNNFYWKPSFEAYLAYKCGFILLDFLHSPGMTFPYLA